MHILLSGSFCFSEAPWLSWEEVRYGLDCGFLDSNGVIEYAVNKLSSDSSAEHYDLAFLNGYDDYAVRACIDRLVIGDFQDIENLKKAWIFLTFLWVFKNKNQYEDPLGVVEELYADFNYPESIAPIVRYMPSSIPFAESEDQLYNNWFDILSSFRRDLQADRIG